LSTNGATATAWGGVLVQVDLWSAAPTFNNDDRGAWSVLTGSRSHPARFQGDFSAVGSDGAGDPIELVLYRIDAEMLTQEMINSMLKPSRA
jgi:hypothetical protein